MSDVLTPMRESLWNAIDNWHELQGAFKRRFRFDDEKPDRGDVGPGPNDLPAIAVFPASVDPEWMTHVDSKWLVAYSVQLWTKGWHLPTAEQLSEKVVRALFQCNDPASPGGALTYIRQATGFPPTWPLPRWTFQRTAVEESDLNLNRAGTSKSKAILTTLTVVLRTSKNPFTN